MRLIEREAELRVLGDALEDTRTGSGALMLVGGEAGAGKSALASTFLKEVAVPVAASWCDGASTPRPLGPVIEIAAQVEVDVTLPRYELFGALVAALARQPIVVLIEDVHWIDEASADFLRHAARRLDRTPALLVSSGNRPALARPVPWMNGRYVDQIHASLARWETEDDHTRRLAETDQAVAETRYVERTDPLLRDRDLAASIEDEGVLL